MNKDLQADKQNNNSQETVVDFSKAERSDDTKWRQRGVMIENSYGNNKVGVAVPAGMVLGSDSKGGLVFRTYEEDEKFRSRTK